MGSELFEKVQELYYNHEYEKALALLENAPSAEQGDAIRDLRMKVYCSLGYICQAKSVLTEKIEIIDDGCSASRVVTTFARLFPRDSRSLPLAERAWKVEPSEASLVALIFSLLHSNRGSVEQALEIMKANEHMLSQYSKQLCDIVIAQMTGDVEQTLVLARWLLENLLEPVDASLILKALLFSTAKIDGFDSVVNRIQEFSEHKSLKHPADRAFPYKWAAVFKMKQNDYVQALHFLRIAEELVSTSGVDLPDYVEILVLTAICQYSLDNFRETINNLENSLDLIEKIGWCYDQDDNMIVYKLVSHAFLAPLNLCYLKLTKFVYHHKQLMGIRNRLGPALRGTVWEYAARIMDLREKTRIVDWLKKTRIIELLKKK